jgi:hypothetical protein
VGLELGPLSLVSTTEELLSRNSSGCPGICEDYCIRPFVTSALLEAPSPFPYTCPAQLCPLGNYAALQRPTVPNEGDTSAIQTSEDH